MGFCSSILVKLTTIYTNSEDMTECPSSEERGSDRTPSGIDAFEQSRPYLAVLLRLLGLINKEMHLLCR